MTRQITLTSLSRRHVTLGSVECRKQTASARIADRFGRILYCVQSTQYSHLVFIGMTRSNGGYCRRCLHVIMWLRTLRSVCRLYDPVVKVHILGQPLNLHKFRRGFINFHDPHLIHGSLSESAAEWHLDRFSRFCRAHPCDQHADRQTDRQTDTRASSAVIGRMCTVQPEIE